MANPKNVNQFMAPVDLAERFVKENMDKVFDTMGIEVPRQYARQEEQFAGIPVEDIIEDILSSSEI
jgi:hypothetical protein